jgi:hypothetical protein
LDHFGKSGMELWLHFRARVFEHLANGEAGSGEASELGEEEEALFVG